MAGQRHATRGAHACSFTLIELLVVIAVITVLAAILLPVFWSARKQAGQTTCIGNLRQIGLALVNYTEDYDNLFPYAVDPSDKYTNIWQPYPTFYTQVQTMPMLQDAMSPYINSPKTWECPDDSGFDTLDSNFSGGQPVALNARPTMFTAFGTSYFYRTEIALRQIPATALCAYDSTPPYAQHGPADVNMVMDGNGSWHGSGFIVTQKRFTALMGDGHAQSLSAAEYYQYWQRTITPPGTPGP